MLRLDGPKQQDFDNLLRDLINKICQHQLLDDTLMCLYEF